MTTISEADAPTLVHAGVTRVQAKAEASAVTSTDVDGVGGDVEVVGPELPQARAAIELEAPSPDEPAPAGPLLVDPWSLALARLRALPAYRSMAAQTLTAPGGVVLAVLLTVPAVLVDLVLGGELGRASVVGVLVACVAAALTVRPKALATVAVLPPLLVAGAVTSLAWLGGRNDGLRQLVLDAGTTLAFSAPELFGVTALTVAVVLARLAWQLVRR